MSRGRPNCKPEALHPLKPPFSERFSDILTQLLARVAGELQSELCRIVYFSTFSWVIVHYRTVGIVYCSILPLSPMCRRAWLALIVRGDGV